MLRGGVGRFRSPRGTGAVVGTAPPPGAPARRPRVLVVEDEPIVGDLLVEVLAAEGCEVEAVENGRQALERVRACPFDLIVCDVRMPDVDGPAFFRALGAVDPDLARRVVFITGDTVRAETREFLERTGVAYLEKPFDLTDLRALARRASGAL